jgi:hypothetical protein
MAIASGRLLGMPVALSRVSTFDKGRKMSTSFVRFGRALSGLSGCLLAVALIGCGPTLVWVRPGAEPGQSDQQLAACTLQSEQTFYSTDEGSDSRDARTGRWTKLCMRANGWRQQEVY